MKRVGKVQQILHDVYGNAEGTGNYRAWEDHTYNEIEFFDESTSKLTVNIISENICLMSTQREGTLGHLRKYVITGRIGVQYQRGLYSMYLIMTTRPQKG